MVVETATVYTASVAIELSCDLAASRPVKVVLSDREDQCRAAQLSRKEVSRLLDFLQQEFGKISLEKRELRLAPEHGLLECSMEALRPGVMEVTCGKVGRTWIWCQLSSAHVVQLTCALVAITKAFRKAALVTVKPAFGLKSAA